MNGIISLAPGGIGPAMMCEMIKRNDLLRLSETVINRFTTSVFRKLSPSFAAIYRKIAA
ncbi:class I and II aminotransferase [Escherichia coli]|uniref:Class I and II aminotransferase n=1 Tax=Escherichia coli TaxID=562 RepID=A0A376VUL1_ECOLX|nr:class I and II aminotransferase [Escherichia coli]